MADSKDIREQFKWVTDSGKYTYAEVKEHLSWFTSKVWFGDDWFGLSSEQSYLINKMVQAIFWIAKTIFSVCAGIYEKLTDLSQFDTYIKQTLNISASLFSSLFYGGNGNVGLAYLLVPCIALYLAYLYFFKNASFSRAALKFILVLALITVFFKKSSTGNYLIYDFYKGVNDISNELVTRSIGSFKSVTETKEGQSESLLKKYNEKDQSPVLDKYFEVAIWTPYRYMNSTIIHKKDGSIELNLDDNSFKELLGYNDGLEEFTFKDGKFKGKDLRAVTEDDDTNEHVLGGKNFSDWGQKFTYAFVGVIDSISLGVILDLLAITGVVFKVTLLALFLLSFICLILAFVPTFDNILFNLFKKIFGAIVVSAFLSFGAILLLWFYDIINTILAALFASNGFLMACAKITLIIVLWKKRDNIMSVLTANRVAHLSNAFTNKLDSIGSSFGQRGQRMMNRGAERVRGVRKEIGTRGKQYSKGFARLGMQKFRDRGKPKQKKGKDNRYNGNFVSFRDKMSVENGLRSVRSGYHQAKGKLQEVRAMGMQKDGKETFGSKDLKEKASKQLAKSSQLRTRNSDTTVKRYEKRIQKELNRSSSFGKKDKKISFKSRLDKER